MPRKPLSDIILPSAVMDAAFATPAMKIKPRSKRVPTIDDATKAVLAELKQSIANTVVEELQPIIQDAYDTHVLMEGEYEDATDKDAWESAVDEQVVEANIEKYVPDLSQDWLGEHTIGAGLHIEGGIAKFCLSLGKEYYKQITYGKTPAQVLSSAGITTPEIQARLDVHINPTEEEKQAMAEEANDDLQAVYQKIADHIGKDHDTMAVYDDIELAYDDDDGLAFGAAARIGLDEADVDSLRMVALEHGKDAVDIIQHAVQAILDGGKKSKKKAPAAAKPAKAATPKAEKPAKKEPGAVLEGSVLETLKNCGAGDTETSKALGLSRQTYTNYINGKTAFTPTGEQYAYLRGEIVERLNALHEALAAIDGGEAETVF